MLPIPMIVMMALGCGQPDGDGDRVRDTAADPAPTGPDCDPTVQVPLALGASLEREPDPHSDLLGAAPEPFAVHYGWPSSDPSTSASFLWRTDLDTLASVIEYGTGGELTERLEGASYRYGGAADGPGDYRIHEVKLCAGLEPGTAYSYRVGGKGAWSPTYTFVTPGAPGTFDTFRVAVAGDSRGAYETWADVVAAMEAHDPDFYVFTGDIVEFGTLQDEWDAWFAATGDVLARKALIPAHGNHEFLATNYFAQFSLPGNEEWFSIRYGDLQLVTLNDTVRSFADRDEHQVTFQEEVFGATDARWKVPMHHSSAYATCSRHRSDESVRAAWEPVWDAHDIDLVLAGHNHVYERSVPIRGGQQVPDGEGAVYIVSGGGGGPLYDEFEDQWWGAVATAVEHYLILDFGPDGIHAVARDLSGNVIDEFSIPR